MIGATMLSIRRDMQSIIARAMTFFAFLFLLIVMFGLLGGCVPSRAADLPQWVIGAPPAPAVHMGNGRTSPVSRPKPISAGKGRALQFVPLPRPQPVALFDERFGTWETLWLPMGTPSSLSRSRPTYYPR